MHRYALEVCDVGRGRRGTTVRVNDGEPGDECQIDFGKLGVVFDSATGRRRVCHALIFTPVVSRYTFVWLRFRQTIDDVIVGCEAAWVFFGGVFTTVIPDNTKAIVQRADTIEPRLNQAFVEYAQSRGFLIDPARVRSPQDKPRVERTVPFVRQSFFAGEDFVDLADAQRRVEETSEVCLLASHDDRGRCSRRGPGGPGRNGGSDEQRGWDDERDGQRRDEGR